MTEPLVVHAAPTVVPIAGQPIASGAVAVRGDRIVAVGSRDRVLGDWPGAELVTWSGVLMPGLVNAHTHLQYTSFDAVGAVTHPSYVDWARRFVDEYAARADEDWAATARRGLDEALRTGTTCLADVVTDEAVMDVLFDAGVAGVAYFELIGTDADEWDGQVRATVERVVTSAPATPVTRAGISPHAPYSVAPDVIAATVDLARRLGVRLHSHVGEITGEDEVYRTGTGSWAERIRSVQSKPWPLLIEGGRGMSTAEFTAAVGLIGPDVHLAHGIYLDAPGRETFARAGTLIALCPRSNRAVGEVAAPVDRYLAEGVPFAIGTDGLSSNSSLDLMADVSLLFDIATASGDVDGGVEVDDGADIARRLLTAATRNGATALGLAEHVGALTPGRRADLAVFDVDPDTRVVERSLVTAGAGRAIGTVVAGDVRYGVPT